MVRVVPARVEAVRSVGAARRPCRGRMHAGGFTVRSAEPGFLVGGAGVGLALLALTGAIDGAWARALCLGPIKTLDAGLSP